MRSNLRTHQSSWKLRALYWKKPRKNSCRDIMHCFRSNTFSSLSFPKSQTICDLYIKAVQIYKGIL